MRRGRKFDDLMISARCRRRAKLLCIREVDLHTVGHDHVARLLVGRARADHLAAIVMVLLSGAPSLCEMIVIA